MLLFVKYCKEVSVLIITHCDLAWTRRRFKNKKIVYCSGSFDLPHLGHALLFKKCKSLGDILVVNVGCDYDISQSKPGRPIMPQLIRLRTVNEFKPVDFCFLGKRLLKSQNSQARVVEIFKSLQRVVGKSEKRNVRKNKKQHENRNRPFQFYFEVDFFLFRLRDFWKVVEYLSEVHLISAEFLRRLL